jgi:hypothetical protein
MRVAGTVIWATDLVEVSQSSGAKGQPDTTYNYSVSLAVALSSRAVGGIGRIWADGKLLRGAAGDFKVSTKFRFYPGDQDQEVDPLIASAEGLANTPAYRGMAVALAELSGALTEAQQLLFELDPVLHSDTCELYQRIEAARLEVRLLQLSRSKAPKRTKFGAHDEGALSNSHR